MEEMSVTKTYSMTMKTIGMASDLGERTGLGASRVIRLAIEDLFRRAEADPTVITQLKEMALGAPSEE